MWLLYLSLFLFVVGIIWRPAPRVADAPFWQRSGFSFVSAGLACYIGYLLMTAHAFAK